LATRTRKILRQFKRYLGDDKAEEVFCDFGKRLSGAEKLPEDIGKLVALLQKFSDFSAAIEKSYLEYEDRLKIASRNIEISSKELTTALRDLEKLNANINAMLDGLGQGLVFFNKEGVCSETYSKACLDLFDIDPAGKHVGDVLGFDPDGKEHLRAWLNVTFLQDTALDFDDMKELLTDKIINDEGRHIELDYRPLYGFDDHLSAVLLIASDVTDRVESEARLKESRRDGEKIQTIAQNRRVFYNLVKDLSAFLDTARRARAESFSRGDTNHVLRKLHSFKGQAGQLGMERMAGLLHDLETQLDGRSGKEFLSCLKRGLVKIDALLGKEIETGKNLFGDDFIETGNVRPVAFDKIRALETLLAEALQGTEKEAHIRSFLFENFIATKLFDCFSDFKNELRRLAEDQGKYIPEVVFSGENIPVDYSVYEGFFASLVQYARNLVDHAIEPPDKRALRGKGKALVVEVRAALEDGMLQVAIKDDGPGIDAGRMREKLAGDVLEDGRKYSDREIIQFVFTPTVSLKDDVSMTSGRGMGMNIIYEEVRRLGGSIILDSDYKNAAGTELVFSLPYKDEAKDTAHEAAANSEKKSEKETTRQKSRKQKKSAKK